MNGPGEESRVVYYDARYPDCWVRTPENLAQELLHRGGFYILNADELAVWMKRRIDESAAGSVCVLSMGIAPNTVYDLFSHSVSIRYVKAGGRLVWVGDVPFYYRGSADRQSQAVGDSGHKRVLGFPFVWNQDPPEITAEGREWGLTQADEAARPVELKHVTVAFSKVKQFACSWLLKLGEGEFIRYRGGAFPGPDWDAGVRDLLSMALHGLAPAEEDAAVDLALTADPELHATKRVVFSDPEYPNTWVCSPGAVAKRLGTAGFKTFDAEQLAAWMESQTAAGAEGSVCVLAHGVAPDTIAEAPSHTCLVRQYLDAGGRVVWLGDIPFFRQGRRGRRSVEWGPAGHQAVLGLPFGSSNPASSVTPAGKEWGLSRPDAGTSTVETKHVSVAFTEDKGWAGTWLKNYNPRVPGSGFIRYRAGSFDDVAWCDEVKALALHALPSPARPGAAAAPPPAKSGTQIAGGAFIVDREAALDKMMRFQLARAQQYLLPWLRLAAASGAARAAITTTKKGVTVQFDGAALPSVVYQDPYAGIFGEVPREEAVAARQLALGLLSALRQEPVSVRLESGSPGARRALWISGLADKRPEEATTPHGTTLHVLWSRDVSKLIEEQLQHVRLACDRSRLRVTIDGEALRRETRVAPGERLELGDFLYGHLVVPSDVRPVSLLDVYTYGVRVGQVQVRLPTVQVEGWVNDDAFRLSASQSGVVRDRRFWRTMRRLAAEAENLLLETAREHAARMPATAKLIAFDGKGRLGARERLGFALASHWQRGLLDPRSESVGVLRGAANSALRNLIKATGGSAERRERAVREVMRDVRITRWLRDATVRLLPLANDADDDAKDPIKKALWEAPILVTPDGRAPSLLTQERQRRLIGYVPYWPYEYPIPDGPLPYEAPWIFCAQDLDFLQRRFGTAAKDVAGSWVQMRKIRASAGKTASVTLATGQVRPVGRKLLREGPWKGEVALTPDSGEGSSRVFFFSGGEPAGFHDLKSPMRFAAALELPAGRTMGPTPEEVRSAEEAVLREARALHAKVGLVQRRSRSQRYDDHLCRFLWDACVRAKGGKVLPEDRWIEDLPILRFHFRRSYDHRLSFKLFRRAALAGRPFLTRGPHNGQWRNYPDIPFLQTGVPATEIGPFLSALLPEATVNRFRDTPFNLVFVAPAGLPPWEGLKAPGRELELIQAVVHQHGTLANEPGNPARRALIEAVAKTMSPWPEGPKDAAAKRVAALLGLLPLFRYKGGNHTALRELAEQKLTAAVLERELALEPWEREALYRLFPEKTAEEEGSPEAPLQLQAKELVAKAHGMLSELRAGHPGKPEDAAAYVARQPVLRRLLAAELPDDVKTAYLASVLATRLNRASRALDDPEDARFQTWLADQVQA